MKKIFIASDHAGYNLKYHNAFNGGEENRVHLVACVLDYKYS